MPAEVFHDRAAVVRKTPTSWRCGPCNLLYKRLERLKRSCDLHLPGMTKAERTCWFAQNQGLPPQAIEASLRTAVRLSSTSQHAWAPARTCVPASAARLCLARPHRGLRDRPVSSRPSRGGLLVLVAPPSGGLPRVS
jgi:hypothetical protein